VKHNLKEIARARFIRFQPTNYSTHKALRVEVFGILKPAGTVYLASYTCYLSYIKCYHGKFIFYLPYWLK